MPGMRLFIFGNIGPERPQSIAEALNQATVQYLNMKTQDPAIGPYEVELVISSWGGDVGSSFAVYNLLRASSFKITTYNAGEISSAATLIFLAGEERYAAKHSFFKIHPMTWDFGSTGSQAARRVQDIHASIEAFHAMMADLYEERTRLTKDEITGYLNTTKSLTPPEAREKGFIDDIREPPV